MFATSIQKARPIRPFRSGFTLIEMLSVVVIIAILAAVVVPKLSASDDLAADAAARVIIGDLLYAQSQAIATEQMQYVSFAVSAPGSNGGYGIYSAQPFVAPVTNPVNGKPYTVTYGIGSASELENAKLSAVSLDGSTNTVLAFDELGQPYACTATGPAVPISTTATITLQSGLKKLLVSVEPDTGNITVP